MSGDSEQNKSEAATPHKLEQARNKGQVAKSAELGLLATLLSALGYLFMAGDALFAELVHACGRLLAAAGTAEGAVALRHWAGRAGDAAIAILLPLCSVVFIGVALAMVAQNGLLVAPAALRPDWSRLNPAQGIKRLWSMQTLIEMGKTFLKFLAYGLTCFLVLEEYVRTLAQSALDTGSLIRTSLAMGLRLLIALTVVTALFALADQVIARRMFARQMRMSRQELKQEFKQREGDPRIRQRRRQLQRELVQRAASARGVRQADVVITNPTHYLVGLKYDRTRMGAPTVVARARGKFALRLRAIALRHNVVIVPSPLLARQLFHGVQQGSEIPSSLFGPVVAIYLKLRSHT